MHKASQQNYRLINPAKYSHQSFQELEAPQNPGRFMSLIRIAFPVSKLIAHEQGFREQTGGFGT
jgi:hypothetical protein